ncbi:MAG: hypothetical protein BAJALOKI3v1_30071 [Promethearchaeota archaeon]|nr:MAG: hypothetical protein BAJALOKI3v1_30071 [Candidatus Lokiarchaeota archaeon]
MSILIHLDHGQSSVFRKALKNGSGCLNFEKKCSHQERYKLWSHSRKEN